MTREKFYEIFGNINEDFVQEAHISTASDEVVPMDRIMSEEKVGSDPDEIVNLQQLEKRAISISEINVKKHNLHKSADRKINWLKRGAIVACLCLLVWGVGIGIPEFIKNMFSGGGMFNNGSIFGNEDDTILKAHRNEITEDIESHILEQLKDYAEVKKAYVLLFNTWFLSDELTDFSQVVTDRIFYVVPGDEDNPNDPFSYTTYDVKESGAIEWDSSAYAEKTEQEEDALPSEFFGLTYEVIENALSDVTYEDYIITYSQSIRSVIIWVRSEKEDVFLTYPSRPDFVGLEKGGIYTLKEMQEILTEAYKSE